MDIPFRKSRRGVTLNIRVELRSSRAGVAGVIGDTLKVKLTSPPVEGAANRQLIEVLSGFLNIKKSSIQIIKGEKSRNKVVEIRNLPASSSASTQT